MHFGPFPQDGPIASAVTRPDHWVGRLNVCVASGWTSSVNGPTSCQPVKCFETWPLMFFAALSAASVCAMPTPLNG